MVLSGVFASLMNVTIKGISTELHPFQIAFIRALFGLIVLLPFMAHAARQGTPRTTNIGLHAARGLLNGASMLMFFFALSLSPLATVTALNFTAPLFAVALGAFLLKERIRPSRLLGLLFGFAGTLIILRPGIVEMSLGEAAILVAAASWASAMLIIKKLSQTETSLTITTWGTLFVCVFTAIPAILVWQWPALELVAWLVLIGICGSGAQLSLARAFSLADTSFLMPLEFLKLLWAVLLGLLIFGETPDLWTMLGGVVIFVSATYVVLREGRRG